MELHTLFYIWDIHCIFFLALREVRIIRSFDHDSHLFCSFFHHSFQNARMGHNIFTKERW